MEKVKKAVGNLVSRDDRHTTTVDEEVRQPVTSEHVRPQEHENVTTAVDKDIHQDHHHTTVQPVNTRETLPEKHSHKVLPTEHRSYEHGGDKNVQSVLDRDAAKYKDTSVRQKATHETTTEAPIVAGERVHHHVHEHVQPIIQKETIAPEVIHTTVPVHETHHATPMHHGTKVLPPQTLDEFTGQQGSLQSKGSHMTGEFEGCPTFDRKDLQKNSAGEVGQGQ
ncbi:uncharacterized protein TRIVIDRAFT_52434 [Trichoderma virens Gv29-8]|uniref:Allergen n=1 Tax=Hypocrea virens (strain Gv29-8 / FGSC 10586) TaxID=413071 RepID=G9MG61_HYPVG|nr:uncharacterized protein TRIVIDRAFT_52434 [Trichoderma virens Gv29-8]EHK26511.1 hypothetical protein TRIVIDRAFT_52434 [Trichoderma virens Gv29-8]UKZ46692.1 hypothetical protein TrVGV298_000899 [Trichoderma virens]